MRLEYKGRNATFYRQFIEDQGIDTSNVFEFMGEYYRPVAWSENKEELRCRTLEQVGE